MLSDSGILDFGQVGVCRIRGKGVSMGFGRNIKELRLRKRLSLREFSRQINMDASNWSKIEREVIPPPQDEAKLMKIAKVLGITLESDQYSTLGDLAAIDSGIIPRDLLNDEETLKSLPIFFRTIRNKRPTEEQLQDLIESMRKGG
jgi:transcriptional regulator with XRE-family HTH domain